MHDPFPSFEFLKLGQLGQMFGMSATAVGTKLKQVGLRLPNGEPAEKAKKHGVVRLVEVDGVQPFWSWEKSRTVKVLEAFGWHRIGPTPAPVISPPSSLVPALSGPFTSRPQAEGGDGFEIVDSDGTVAVWVRGDRLSRRLAEVMTLADRCGKL